AHAATVVFELELDFVLAGRQLIRGGNLVMVLLLVGEGVVEARLAVHDDQSPTAETAADRGEHSGGAFLGDVDIGGHGEGTVARDGRAPFRDARHAGVVGELGPPLGQAGPD